MNKTVLDKKYKTGKMLFSILLDSSQYQIIRNIKLRQNYI